MTRDDPCCCRVQQHAPLDLFGQQKQTSHEDYDDACCCRTQQQFFVLCSQQHATRHEPRCCFIVIKGAFVAVGRRIGHAGHFDLLATRHTSDCCIVLLQFEHVLETTRGFCCCYRRGGRDVESQRVLVVRSSWSLRRRRH